jgi:hypothetical protein
MESTENWAACHPIGEATGRKAHEYGLKMVQLWKTRIKSGENACRAQNH